MDWKANLDLSCSVFYAVPKPLTTLSSHLSTVLQTRRRAPASHARWDCPPALLPLAPGDICGGCSHCGLDHLCQEPGGQGGSHEETQVLLKESIPMESQAQKLLAFTCRARVFWCRRWKGPQQVSRSSSLRGSRNGHNGRLGNIVVHSLCVSCGWRVKFLAVWSDCSENPVGNWFLWKVTVYSLYSVV